VLQTWLFAANTYGRVAAWLAGTPVVVVAEMAVDIWKGKLERFLDRQLGTWCDVLVGNSQAVVDFYRGLGVPDSHLAMIYSGTTGDAPPDINAGALRTALGFEPKAPLILFAGRLAQQKRVEDLLKALDLIQHVQPDVCTVIVGDGPLRPRLEKTAHLYHLGERVRFLGHRDDVPRWLAAADLVVLSSEYEGLPNIVLEAMQYSKPVVATAAPGTTEVVVNGETGILVPIGNITLLARAIRDLVRNPSLARRLGHAGRARMEAHFRAETMVTQFARLYEDLARAKGLSTE
jgi:glycosyltransferase involved in cell wall biosynthesis